MSTVQLSDIYVPEPFQHGVDEAAIEKNAFLQSGIISESPVLSAMASTGGYVGEIPFYSPISTSGEPDYTTDDPEDVSVPDKIGSGKQLYRLAAMHKSWSTMVLVS